MGLLKGLAALGDDAFVDVAQALCKIAKVRNLTKPPLLELSDKSCLHPSRSRMTMCAMAL